MNKPSSHAQRVILGLLTAAAAATSSSAANVLWSIGTKDTNTAEFALGPRDYHAYRQPGVFIVGQSDPKKDWPYVQPGPADAGWAPGTPQTFEIFFGLEAAPAEACRLELDFADTHSSGPPKLRVQVNDFAAESRRPRAPATPRFRASPPRAGLM